MRHGLQAVILADSVPQIHNFLGPIQHARLITMEITYWRGVHAEHLRHRMFSFSVASSRAIPTKRMLRQVLWHPYCPESFGRLIPGMQSGGPLGPVAQWVCRRAWLLARFPVLAVVLLLLLLKVHKQWCNRLLEPWMWVTVICTGGIRAWEGFWKLRCHPAAEPHIRRMAEMTRDLVASSDPKVLLRGQCHLPMAPAVSDPIELDIGYGIGVELLPILVSAGRCAAVSYDNHGTGTSIFKDAARAERMLRADPPHASPFEHQACVASVLTHVGLEGNLPNGWFQFRKIAETSPQRVMEVVTRFENLLGDK